MFMPQNNNFKFFGNDASKKAAVSKAAAKKAAAKKTAAKKAFGDALLGAGVVFLILIAYFAIHYSSLQDPQQQQASGIKKISTLSELQKYLAENSDTYGYGYGGLMARSALATEQMAVTGASKSAPDNGASNAPQVSGVSGVQDYSQTNIQVAGVDEADIVKTDGNYIYTVSGNNVYIVSAVPAENAKIYSKIEFTNGSINEIFVNGDKFVVFGQVYQNYAEPIPVDIGGGIATKMAASSSSIARMPIRYSPKTTVKIYDIADRNNPSLISDISIEGSYYDSRMIGNYVYTIANQPTYYLYDANNNVTAPRIYANGNAVSATFPDIYYFEDIPGNVFTTVASINLDNPSDIASKVLLTNYAQNMYVSEKNIYITYTKWMSEADYIDRMVEIIKPLVPLSVQEKIDAAMALEISKQTKMQAVAEILGKYAASLSSEEQRAFEESAQAKMQELEAQIAKEREKTIIQKIAIDSGNIEYKTSGEVPGNTLNQFSMDEYNGYFRIATTTSGNGGIIVPMGIAVRGSAAGSTAQVSAVTSEPSITSMQKTETSQVLPAPKEIYLLSGSDENFIFLGHNVSVKYILRNSEHILDVTIDGNKETIIKNITEQCSGGHCLYYGQSGNLSFIIEPLTWKTNEAGEKVWSFDTWNTSELYFEMTASAEQNQAATTPAVPAQNISPIPNPQPNGPLNHVYVLDADLKIVGTLEDIAPGERIYSVRFLGDKAYMVTFRQIDPLFVIDLSVPEDPKVLGYLKIPGVSDYLHPYDETHIIGLGRDATDEGRIQGMKLSLFDVSDFANPKEISKYIIGEQGTSSDALYDHKAFLFSKEKNLLVIPVSEYGANWKNYWQGAYVFNIDIASGISLKGKVSHANETQSSKDSYYNYDYNAQIRRSLYINSALYTISQKMIKINALDTLDELNKVALPYSEQNYYGGVVY